MRGCDGGHLPSLSVCVIYHLRRRGCLGLLLHSCHPPPPLLLIVVFAQSLLHLLPSTLAHLVCRRLVYCMPAPPVAPPPIIPTVFAFVLPLVVPLPLVLVCPG